MQRLFIVNDSRSTVCLLMVACVNEKREDVTVDVNVLISIVLSSLLFIIISVLFVVLIIQILLLLQHVSEIQSSEMLHVAIQYHCVLLKKKRKEKSALWDYFCLAFTSNCK